MVAHYHENIELVFSKIMPIHCENIILKIQSKLPFYNNETENTIQEYFDNILKNTNFMRDVAMQHYDSLLVCYGVTLYISNLKIKPEICDMELFEAVKYILKIQISELVIDSNEIDMKMYLILKKFNFLFMEKVMNYILEYIVIYCGKWLSEEVKARTFCMDDVADSLVIMITQRYVREISRILLNPSSDGLTADLIYFQNKIEK